MVTTRDGGSFLRLQQAKSLEYFQKFGRSDFTLVKYSETLNARGRLATQTSTSTTKILGDLQFDRKVLQEYIDIGIAQRGNGIFYTVPSTDISANDEIQSDGVTWKLTAQVEGEESEGQVVYQGWIAVKKPTS